VTPHASDGHLERAVTESAEGRLLIPTTVVVEVCWLVEERSDVEAAFLEAVATASSRSIGSPVRSNRGLAAVRPLP
jgi:hypothetical protein